MNLKLFLLLLALPWSAGLGQAQTDGITNTTSGNVTVVPNSPKRPVVAKLIEELPLSSEVTPDWVLRLSADLPFLRKVWWGNEVWKYCASLVYIFLAFYVSKLLDFLVRVWLRRWVAKTTLHFDELLLNLLSGPLKIVTLVFFLHIGLGIFSWPGRVEIFLDRAFTILVAITLTYMVLGFVDVFMSYWRQRAAATADGMVDEQLFPIIRKSLKVFVIVVAVLVTAQNLQINVTAAITSLSIGGLAIGLAAQDTLANLFGAVAVFMDKPFRLGDRIQLDAVDGNVESIGLRSTRVRNGKGFLITIPNKTVAAATITNISRRPSIQTELNFGLAYDTTDEKLRSALAIIEEIFRSNPMTRDIVVSFNKFVDSGLNISVVHLSELKPDKEYLAGMQQFNLRIKERFDAEGIQMGCPGRMIYVKQVPQV